MKKLPLWATFAPKRVPKICLFSNQRSQNWHKISLWATFAPKRGPKISHFNHKNKSKLTRRFWATFFLALGDFLPKPSGHTEIKLQLSAFEKNPSSWNCLICRRRTELRPSSSMGNSPHKDMKEFTGLVIFNILTIIISPKFSTLQIEVFWGFLRSVDKLGIEIVIVHFGLFTCCLVFFYQISCYLFIVESLR